MLTVDMGGVFFLVLELRFLYLYALSMRPLDLSTTHILNNYNLGIMSMPLLLYIFFRYVRSGVYLEAST